MFSTAARLVRAHLCFKLRSFFTLIFAVLNSNVTIMHLRFTFCT